MPNFQDKANFIWTVADDILRNTFKANEYGDAILPFVVMRRLDCVHEPHEETVRDLYGGLSKTLDSHALEATVTHEIGLPFANLSGYSLKRLADDPQAIRTNFDAYYHGFTKNVREILEHYQIEPLVNKLDREDLLFMMVQRFTEINLDPGVVSNHEMGSIFEVLLRRFSEMSNETAGEHYTPREVIRLMVQLIFVEHEDDLTGSGAVLRSVYDPACGTGGMLSIAKKYIKSVNPDAEVDLFGYFV